MKNEKSGLTVLPGYNCGVCGFKTCTEFSDNLIKSPDSIKRCIHLGESKNTAAINKASCEACLSCEIEGGVQSWTDSLGRDFDFILDLFPNDPGPRETIRLHNPILTRELNVQKGDILIGRPLGMSCGCPVTHCGVAVEVDMRTGIIVWCVTGPLNPRHKGFKDLGYYSAEAYEGIVKESKVELKIGMRYWFMPHKCMLQWRHSGLINFLNSNAKGTQVRLEGLLIG